MWKSCGGACGENVVCSTVIGGASACGVRRHESKGGITGAGCNAFSCGGCGGGL